MVLDEAEAVAARAWTDVGHAPPKSQASEPDGWAEMLGRDRL
jgi:hypothetical protein